MQWRGHRLLWTAVILTATLMVASKFQDRPTPSVSAVETPVGVAIYWDKNCNNPVYSIDWGVLSPGESRQFAMYVRNEGNTAILVAFSTENYSPTNASRLLNFVCTPVNCVLQPNKTTEVKQNLSVSRQTTGISSFSFDIVFIGGQYLLGDINVDGDVDLYDALLLAVAFNSTPICENWNCNADLNEDQAVDIFDAIILSALFGTTR